MKRHLLGKFMLAAGLMASVAQVDAQTQPLSSGKVGSDLAVARFLVNTPAAITGLKKISIATWGAQPNTPINNAPVVKGLDSLAALPLTNASAIAGKFCLLYRGGGVSFAQKALYAQNAGATGVIIVNNIAGDPIAMGNTGTATINIPVVMLTDVDGNAMNTQLRNSVATTVTLGKWNLGGAHDLGVLTGYGALPHALNIPLAMWSNTNNVLAYKNWIGGAVGNFGTSAETNITVTDSIVWVPTTGSPSMARTHNYNIASIGVTDSFKFGFGGTSSYYLTPQAGNGRYDYYSKIAYNNTDATPQDNISMFSQYINDSIFCKGTFDYTRGEPRVTQGIQTANGSTPHVRGPMFFMTKGGHAAQKIQSYISKNNVTDLSGISISAFVFKWTDGLAIAGGTLDSVVSTEELELVGIGGRTFGANDSSGKVYTMNIGDAASTGKPPVLDSNAWYWICVQNPSDCFVGVDETVSAFTRPYVQNYNGIIEYPETFFFEDILSATGSGSTPTGLFNYPYAGTGYARNIDSVRYDSYTMIPAVALHISKGKYSAPSSVNNISNIGKLEIYPNPATTGSINVSIKLDQRAATVNYRLINGMGALISDYTHSNVKEENFKISTTGLAAGMYYLLVNDGTENGLAVRKVVIN